MPQADEAVVIDRKTVVAQGGFTVGSLTLSGAAKLTVKAVGLEGEDLKVFETLKTDLAPIAAKLWARTTVVNVRNDFKVKDGATVYPEADKVSGVPVVFKVGGDFELGEGASFNAVERGWGWISGSDNPAGCWTTASNNKIAWTFAPAPGASHNTGGGYGGKAANPLADGRGGTYGSALAPFLPGSCGCLYQSNVDATRGGGAIVIFAARQATVEGEMNVSSVYRDHSGASGGAIWLAAETLSFGSGARLAAAGGTVVGYNGQGAGGGGRIALAEGYTWDDMVTAAGGTVPEGFVVSDKIQPYQVAADVSGGLYTGTPVRGYVPEAGTCTFARKATAPIATVVEVSGEGTVALDGDGHDETFAADLPPNQEVTLTATPADGQSFVGWVCDQVPGGFSTETELKLTATVSPAIRALFAPTATTARNWTGAVSLEWLDPRNWSPEGVPGPNDDVTISGTTQGEMNRLALEFVATASVAVRSLTLTDAALMSIGDAKSRSDATLTLSGDLTVTGGSKLSIRAGTLSDLSVFANIETDKAPIFSALWQAAKIVTVGDDFVVDNGGVVVPDADSLTGVPVFFKVGGDFTVGEDGLIDARERGWGWQRSGTPPAGAKMDVGGNGTAQQALWSLAPGGGRAYYTGGGYGGKAAYPTTSNNQRYGCAYGSAVAPFLPGSNSGFYFKSMTTELDKSRGGGAVVVFTSGKATVNGVIDASSAKFESSGASGGGIWLAAGEFAFGAAARLDAHGGSGYNYKGQGAGGGGRIALAEGYTWADLAAVAASGAVPEGFKDSGTILETEVATDVKGGIYDAADKAYDPEPGTLSFVRSAVKPVKLTVTIVGDGTVTYGATTYTQSFELTVPVQTEQTLTATPAEGARLVSWASEALPGTVAFEPELKLTLETPADMTVTFARGTVNRVWVGGEKGCWNVPLNWKPAGLPTAEDTVALTNVFVWTTGPAAAKTLTLAGRTVLSNAAVTVEGPCDPSSLYAGATVVTVAEALRLEDTAKVIPANDPVTGAAVRYDVGSLFVAAGASFDASGTGWAWFAGTDDERHVDVAGDFQTLAPGRGYSFTQGGGYGGAGRLEYDTVPPGYGQTYGLARAPFLPGSPNGLHNNSIGNMGRPGGTVWIRCAGLAELDGCLYADGRTTYFGSASGGGVWLAARGLKTGASARISAVGGQLTGAYKSLGGGGRVSLALGCTDEHLDALAAGEEPSGLVYSDAVDALPVDVKGGFRNAADGVIWGYAGTATTVIGPNADQQVKVTSRGVSPLGVEPAYGNYAYESGTVQTFTAPAYGVDPDDPSVRYACQGCEVVNAAGEATTNLGCVAQVTVEKGPITLTWLWGASQKRTLVRKPEHCAITVDGVPADGDGVAWTFGQTATFGAVPDEGYEFVCWEGNVPFGKATENPLRATVERPLDIVPVVRPVAAATVRTWNGTGAWTDAAKWEPAGIPGADDAVFIASGTCAVSNRLAAASLTVAAGASLKVGAAGDVNGDLAVAGDVSVAGALTVGFGVSFENDGSNYKRFGARMPGHVQVAVGGDFALTGDGRVEVFGGPVENDFTFARGCGFVDVGGTLSLADTSVLALYSDIYSGGSVRITAKSFTVAEAAKVDAASRGYAWFDSATPPDAPGLGYTFSIGGSHGGTNFNSGTLSQPVRFPYDFARAPTMPGSANGSHSTGARPGGGVIRVHAKAMTIEGTLDASAVHASSFGGAAGGSIWLTADDLAFGANAKLAAHGGATDAQYGSYGAGGRIAIGYKMNEERLRQLAETGEWPGFRSRRQKSLEEFCALYGIGTDIVDLEMGAIRDNTDNADHIKRYEDLKASGLVNGTFTYVDGTKPGLMLLVK